MSVPSEALERYSRQMRFPGLGKAGQEKLLASRVTLCGSGALGTVLANVLARAGVGFIRVIDRDFVEPSNLQRQVLFDESDVANNLPKAEAAAVKLRQINSSVAVEPVVADINRTNIEEFCKGADLILDGSDNFEIRYLINDAAVKLNKPWVYGGSIGSHGQTMTILPGQTPCLRCVFEAAPNPGEAGTCETAGVLSPIVNIIASFQVTEAIKILTGHQEQVSRELTYVDLPRGLAVEQFAQVMGGYAAWYVNGLAALVEHPQWALPTVSELLGRPALPFREWVRRHAASFG